MGISHQSPEHLTRDTYPMTSLSNFSKPDHAPSLSVTARLATSTSPPLNPTLPRVSGLTCSPLADLLLSLLAPSICHRGCRPEADTIDAFAIVIRCREVNVVARYL